MFFNYFCMMTLLIKKNLLIVLLLFPCISFSQKVSTLGNDDEVIRKLEREISLSANDSVKSICNLKIAGFYFKNNNLNNYKSYLQKGRQLSKKSRFLTAYANYYQALMHLYNNDYNKFNTELLSILKNLKPYNHPAATELKLIIIQNISTYYRNNLQHDKSIKILIEEGIPLAKSDDNFVMTGSFNQIIAGSFYSLDEFEKAKIYYEKSIAYYKKDTHKGFDVLNACSVAYAMCLIQLHDFAKSENTLNSVYKTLEINKNNNLYPSLFNAYGTLFYEQKEYAKSILYYNKGLSQYNENRLLNKDEKMYSLLKLGLAQSLHGDKDFTESQNQLDGINLADPEIVLIQNELRYKNYENLKNYPKAYEYLHKYFKVKDSLEHISKETEYRILEAKYNTSEKERKIFQLEYEKREKEIHLRNLQLWYGLVSVSLIIVLVTAYFLYKNYKNQKMLNAQQDIIHKQKLDFLNSAREIEVMQAMIEAEDTERKRIARDLHDGIGSRLSSLNMQLQHLHQKSSDASDLEKLSTNLALAIKDLRETAFNLMPETLSKLGLDMALKDLCSAMSNSTVSILYSSTGIRPDNSAPHQVTIFRIVQELINNALKHSSCTEIIVDCSQNGELFLITVEDNGIGFHAENLSRYSGIGLKNIKKRIKILNGILSIKSVLSKGTIFNIELKVK